jgi:hypothetical protein
MRQPAQPTSLLRALKGPPVMSLQEVKDLAKHKYANPVISLYMRLNPETVVPKEKAPLRIFHSLKTAAANRHQDLLSGLSRQQRQVLTDDINELEGFFAEYFVPEHLRSLIILKSGQQLNRVLRLPVGVTDKFVIDPDPYVLPLEAVLREQEKVLLVETTKEESIFTTYHFGYLQGVGRIQSFVPSDAVDASRPGKVQRHRLAHLQRHLKETAERTYRLWAEQGCDALVLMAETRILHMLEGVLHQSVKEQPISRIYNSPDADSRDRKDLIETGLRDRKAARETSAIAELDAYVPGDELISGLRNVIHVSNLFLVHKLFVSARIHHEGFVCEEHHYLALEGTECPFCGKRLLPVENVVDELVEIARLHGVGVTLVEYKQQLLAKYEGIAAVVYVRTNQAA